MPDCERLLRDGRLVSWRDRSAERYWINVWRAHCDKQYGDE